MEKVSERFLRYVRHATTSDEASSSCPSTPGQIDFGRLLVDELIDLGIKEAVQDKNGYILAALPENTPVKAPAIGFIAHLDTAPDFNGAGVKPQIIPSYQGGDIVLNPKHGIILKEKDFPELRQYLDQDLITTDGTTLLGADDKAGVAEIITAIEYLLTHPEIKHGPIKIAFTPDEEIGRGADYFPLVRFGADFAYTVDGGELGQLENENFNAAFASFIIKGRSVHPGTAKDKMINSMLMANEIINFFPPAETPAQTEGYQGFYHLTKLEGTVEQTILHYIIRDHDCDHFNARKAKMKACAEEINRKYGLELVSLELKDSYYNMKEILDRYPQVTGLAEQALREINVKPLLTPIRGGTDGARLSYMGLPCPNIFTGGHNFHGPYEYIPISSMEKAVQVIVKICELGAKIV